MPVACCLWEKEGGASKEKRKGGGGVRCKETGKKDVRPLSPSIGKIRIIGRFSIESRSLSQRPSPPLSPSLLPCHSEWKAKSSLSRNQRKTKTHLIGLSIVTSQRLLYPARLGVQPAGGTILASPAVAKRPPSLSIR